MQPTMSQIQFKHLNYHRKATKDKALRQLGLCNSRFRPRGLVLTLSHQREQNCLRGAAVATAPAAVRQFCWILQLPALLVTDPTFSVKMLRSSATAQESGNKA